MKACVHVTVAGLLAFARPACADQTIASPPVPNEGQAACYVRNVGNKAVAVSVKITILDGTVAASDFDGCSTPLGPGATCVVLAHPSNINGFLMACSVTASSVKSLRGTLETRNTSFDVLAWANLR